MPVYFISQQEGGSRNIKIGVAKDIQRRRQALQTGSPSLLEVIGWIQSSDDFALEKALHRQFHARRGLGEWFGMEPADVLPTLMQAGIDGFVSKNADAFEVIGYDRDAVPEYLGVWNWGDLELEECCPFCGCLCGMHFQDTSQMYHCLSCDTMTDFSELSPEPDPDGDS
jgi:hypothetical protein